MSLLLTFRSSTGLDVSVDLLPPTSIFASHGQDSRRRQWDYPVVIINWVQYLGPPVPFSFTDARDLLEVLVDFLDGFRSKAN